MYKTVGRDGKVIEKRPLKERHKYHTEIANGTRQVKDFDTGNMRNPTTAEKIRAGVRAEKCRAKLTKFMSKSKNERDAIVKDSKARAKSAGAS